jgi:hypothetical protein
MAGVILTSEEIEFPVIIVDLGAKCIVCSSSVFVRPRCFHGCHNS